MGGLQIRAGIENASNSDGFVSLWTSNSAAGGFVERYKIDSTGVATWSNVGGVAGTAMTLNSTGLGVGVSPGSAIGNLQVGGSTNANLYTQQGTDTVRMGVRASGRTGIILDSSNATYTNRAWYLDNAGSSGSLTIGRQGLDVITFDNVGNVGIGVTPSAWGASLKAFELGAKGNALFTTTSVLDGLFMVNNAYYDTSYKYASTGYASRYTHYQGAHQWFTAPSGTAGNAITFTQAMTLDASGRLLVGTVTSGTSAGDGIVKLGTHGHCISQTGTSIASGSFVDLTISTAATGYQGFLSIANTQNSNANVRTQTTYSVFGRGSTATFTQIATADGPTGGASFTVTIPSNGVIRITNTLATFDTTISAQFFGGTSA